MNIFHILAVLASSMAASDLRNPSQPPLPISRWQSIHSCTSATATSTPMLIDCGRGSLIHIGRAHYGVNSTSNPNSNCDKPQISDCAMDYTEKIGEQCNGLTQCNINLISQYVHKCRAPATYFYLTYKCVKAGQVHDICERTRGSATMAHITSPGFPLPTKGDSDCICSILKPPRTSLNIEIVSKQIQEPDQLQLITHPSGNLTGVSDYFEHGQVAVIDEDMAEFSVKFLTDYSVTNSRFWLTLTAYPECPKDWHFLDSKCVRIVNVHSAYSSAHDKCRRLGGHLLKVGNPLRSKRLINLLDNLGKRNKADPDAWYWVNDLKDTASTAWFWDQSASDLPGTPLCRAQAKSRWNKFDCKRKLLAICEQEFSKLPQRLEIVCGPNSAERQILSDDATLSIFTDEPITKELHFEEGTTESRNSSTGFLIHKEEHVQDNGTFPSTTVERHGGKYNGIGLLVVCSTLFAICLCFCNGVFFYICYHRKRIYKDRLACLDSMRGIVKYHHQSRKFPKQVACGGGGGFQQFCRPASKQTQECCSCAAGQSSRRREQVAFHNFDTISAAGFISSSDETEESLLRHSAMPVVEGCSCCCCCCTCFEHLAAPAETTCYVDPRTSLRPYCGPLINPSTVLANTNKRNTANSTALTNDTNSHFYEQLYSSKGECA